jgi:hypothetical protein
VLRARASGGSNWTDHGSNLDREAGLSWKDRPKSIVSSVSGQQVAEFGTVRPRVQIPGPRPNFEFRIVSFVPKSVGGAPFDMLPGTFPSCRLAKHEPGESIAESLDHLGSGEDVLV